MQALVLLAVAVIILAVVAVCRKGKPPRPRGKDEREAVDFFTFYTDDL